MYLFLLLAPLFLFAQSAEKILAEMSLEEKVGQLFVAPACPTREDVHFEDWKGLLSEYHVGNVIMKQSTVSDQIEFLEELQSLSKYPLLVLADAEWGLAMRISDTIAFPKNMTLGAIQDLSLLEKMGEEVAREARAVGVHMSLGPVVDVNNNPKNSIIHMRSFGDDPKEVSRRGVAMMKGLRKGGLLTCAKHFPGHGDTTVDSHFGLPVLPFGLDRLNEVELPPFKACINAGVDGVMSAHILFSELDSSPATLSYPIMTGLLRDELGFKGLILSDCLNMKALTKHFTAEEIALKAHEAGVDLLLYGDHISEEVDSIIYEQIPTAFRRLVAGYKSGELPIERLDQSVLRILRAKERISDSSPSLLNPEELKEELYSAAITQVGPDLTPIDPDTAYLSLGDAETDEMVPAFCSCITFSWEDREELFDCESVVVSLRNINPRAENYGLKAEEISFFKRLNEKVKVIFCLFGTPYAIDLLPKGASILVGYELDAQKVMLEILEGSKKATGKLPIK